MPEGSGWPAPIGSEADDETLAFELTRRVAARDVGDETLAALELAVDELAVAYSRTPPRDLLPRIRRHLRYADQLLDARKTLAQQRRLLAVCGWLTLLAATIHIDLQQRAVASAELTTALQLARHAEHPEIAAWTLETRAWDTLTGGDFKQAVALSQQAQAVAPRDGSAFIQATAQEGRAHARMGSRRETLAALDRTTRLAAPLATPDRPEHHYRYDPGKALAYTATTLSWLGDPAAVGCAREVVAQMEAVPDGISRPRRIASGRLDLALALLGAGAPDEAATVALSAVTSGVLVPSNWWRATEVLAGVSQAGVREAGDLRDACETYRPAT